MRITLNDDRVFEGTALQIVEQMRSLATFHQTQSVREYIDGCVARALEWEQAGINPRGETEDELAASYLAELVRVGLAR